jgi:hypothetical protein
MTSNKILILILSTNDNQYKNFIDNCTNGWVDNARRNGIRCIFYSGGAIKNTFENDILKLECDDSLSGTAYKLYKALKFIEYSKIEYTHIYRTNLSSFIFIDDFIKFTSNICGEFYAGFVGRYNKIRFLHKFTFISFLISKILKFQVVEFASGSGFFLSRNLVLEIINKNNLKFKYIDDVMIGNALQGKYITPISRYEITDFFPLNFNINCFHVRLKSSNRDIDALRILHLNSYKSLADFIQSKNSNGEKFD